MPVPEGHRRPWRWLTALALVLALGACSDSGADDGGGTDSRGDRPSGDAPDDELPDGLTLDDGFLIRLDTSTPVFTRPFNGAPNLEIQGVLADDRGRREIRVRDTQGGETEVLAAADWNLPAVGAAADGVAIVCYNRLVGSSSNVTEGDVPDPRLGVQLNCRINNGSGWGESFEVGGAARVAWLVGTEIAGDGSIGIDYYRDDGMFIPLRDDHGIYRQQWRNGELETPEPVAPGLGPVEPEE